MKRSFVNIIFVRNVDSFIVAIGFYGILFEYIEVFVILNLTILCFSDIFFICFFFLTNFELEFYYIRILWPISYIRFWNVLYKWDVFIWKVKTEKPYRKYAVSGLVQFWLIANIFFGLQMTQLLIRRLLILDIGTFQHCETKFIHESWVWTVVGVRQLKWHYWWLMIWSLFHWKSVW